MKRSTEGFVGVDPAAAKRAIVDYCSKRGALAVGVADLEVLERIAPSRKIIKGRLKLPA